MWTNPVYLWCRARRVLAGLHTRWAFSSGLALYFGFDTRKIILESRQGALEIPKQRFGAGSVQTDLLTAVYQLLLLFDDLVGFRNMLLHYSSRVSAMPILYQIENPNPN